MLKNRKYLNKALFISIVWIIKKIIIFKFKNLATSYINHVIVFFIIQLLIIKLCKYAFKDKENYIYISLISNVFRFITTLAFYYVYSTFYITSNKVPFLVSTSVLYIIFMIYETYLHQE